MHYARSSEEFKLLRGTLRGIDQFGRIAGEPPQTIS
jgi:hypothetical protein